MQASTSSVCSFVSAVCSMQADCNPVNYNLESNFQTMQSRPLTHNISRIYLILVPFLAAALAFTVGHISYTIYLPIWIVHACLMMIAAWTIGAHLLKSPDIEKKQLIIIALLLIVPWLFISIFFGMGPPPPTVAGWVAAAMEQQVRYYILIGAGILCTTGLVLLRERLKAAGEGFYSMLGFTAIMIKIPLFIVNMAYWGSYLTASFKLFVAAPAEKRPDWYLVMREFFFSIGLVEVGVTYLATAAFAASLKKSGWFTRGACNAYIAFSIVGFLLNLIPPSFPEPLATLSYVVAIPAFSLIMPYLMGINLLIKGNPNKIT